MESLVNIPSYSLKAGDVIGVREKSKSLEVVSKDLWQTLAAMYMSGLLGMEIKMEGTFVTAPERLQIPENIKEQLIVELYSK